MRWNQGRGTIDRMLASAELQISADDVREDAVKAAAIVDISERVLDQMSSF
jgi:hypothetical protein